MYNIRQRYRYNETMRDGCIVLTGDNKSVFPISAVNTQSQLHSHIHPILRDYFWETACPIVEENAIKEKYTSTIVSMSL
jgi:hypothetical protein